MMMKYLLKPASSFMRKSIVLSSLLMVRMGHNISKEFIRP